MAVYLGTEYVCSVLRFNSQPNGGKYGPAAAAAVDEYNAGAGSSAPINLQGLVIADGWCDPGTHAAHNNNSMMYSQGLIDGVKRDVIEPRMQKSDVFFNCSTDSGRVLPPPPGFRSTKQLQDSPMINETNV